MEMVIKFLITLLFRIQNKIQDWLNNYIWTNEKIFLTIWDEQMKLNSLWPGRFWWNFRWVFFKPITVIDGWDTCCEIALRRTSLGLIDDKSTLIQAMAWCHQAMSHYLSQFWTRSMSPYGVIRPQGVNCLVACYYLLWCMGEKHNFSWSDMWFNVCHCFVNLSVTLRTSERSVLQWLLLYQCFIHSCSHCFEFEFDWPRICSWNVLNHEGFTYSCVFSSTCMPLNSLDPRRCGHDFRSLIV